jgi:pimeloyl-ACP methyl ester carboxylesterase
LPFDQYGVCTGPETREQLVHEVAGGYTDVFVFSHGWNNTFDRAAERYEQFIRGYHDLVRSNGLPEPSRYRPLLVGIRWPSIDLVLPWEKEPQIAAPPGAGEPSPDTMDESAMVDVAKESLDREAAGTLEQLAAQETLSEADARELAGLLASAYPSEDEVDADPVRPGTDDVMAIWHELVDAGLAGSGTEHAGPESFGVATEDQSAAEPEAAAGLLSHLDPRDILRAFTVYKMKDRAGLVGAAGGAPLLRDLMSAADRARFHLVGHSFGCRLLLAAVCVQPPPRKVRSLLLLQPAVNCFCFAKEVPKIGKPGGFRTALDRVEEPIFTTFSDHDRALHDFFHIAVRRHSDLGDELKAAALGDIPSLYAALGGWGPAGLAEEAHELTLAHFPNRYELEGAFRVYGLNGATGINGHSDVVNDWTYWALYNQVSA